MWPSKRMGCARSQDGNVLVLKRECTRHMYDVKSGACRSRKYEGTCNPAPHPIRLALATIAHPAARRLGAAVLLADVVPCHHSAMP